MKPTVRCSWVLAAWLACGLVACASAKRSAEAPAPQAPAREGDPATTAPGQDAPRASPASEASTKADPPQPSVTTPPALSPNGRYAAPPNRAAALAQASGEIDSSQRELDVAGGDCRNACRALASMDRAAGRLCGLAQSNDEVRRCGDAKTKVYSARDKVRNTCGRCEDVSVERSAPIPSK